MKILVRCLGILATGLMLGACHEEKIETDQPGRVIMVYMAGDNNLSDWVNTNLLAMNRALAQDNNNCRIVAFADKKGQLPCILSLDGTSIDTLKVYSELNSSNSQTLALAVEYVLENVQASSYGLIMWSHGMGWLPTGQLHYLASSLGYAPPRDGSSAAGYWEGRRNPFKDTRSFGIETQGTKYTAMEIQDLANAIPDGAFDFIAFDACYMGCVEVAYELRDKARYFIASTAEVVERGFPYSTMTQYLARGELINACREFYEYYDCQTGWERMACISLVRTSELDSLAGCMNKIMSQGDLPVKQADLLSVQCYDRFGRIKYSSELGRSYYDHNVFHDLGHAVQMLTSSEELLDEFNTQLDRCVLYHAATPYLFYGTYDQIAIEHFSGLSVYVPTVEYETAGLNADHLKTKWGQAVGY